MSVFRVVKTKDYTKMTNHHLKNKALSLKAKGLLSLMLSLPDDWDYTIKGLSLINRDGIDSIREAVKELERAGYVTRTRKRDAKGRLREADYEIYEEPQPPDGEAPTLEVPALGNPAVETPAQDKPAQGNPILENPTLENPTQSITNRQNIHPEKKKKSITHPCRTNPSNPYQSTPESMDTGGAVAGGDYWRTREQVRQNISYDTLKEDLDRERLDEIVEIMVEALCSTKPQFRISGEYQPAGYVKERLWQINSMHIEYIFGCLQRTAPRITNIKAYLLATLFNAPTTMSNYYDARVEHERYNSP